MDAIVYHALIWVTPRPLEQLVSRPAQLVSATEQLRKCSGAVSKCSGAVSKSFGAVTKVFRSSYESAPEQLINLPEHYTYKFSIAVISLPEHLFISLP